MATLLTALAYVALLVIGLVVATKRPRINYGVSLILGLNLLVVAFPYGIRALHLVRVTPVAILLFETASIAFAFATILLFVKPWEPSAPPLATLDDANGKAQR